MKCLIVNSLCSESHSVIQYLLSCLQPASSWLSLWLERKCIKKFSVRIKCVLKDWTSEDQLRKLLPPNHRPWKERCKFISLRYQKNAFIDVRKFICYLTVPLSPDLQVLDVGNIYDFHSSLTESKWNLVGFEIKKNWLLVVIISSCEFQYGRVLFRSTVSGWLSCFVFYWQKNRFQLVWYLNFFNPHQTGLKRLKKHW